MDEDLKMAMIYLLIFILCFAYLFIAPVLLYFLGEKGIEPPDWLKAILGILYPWAIPGAIFSMKEFLEHFDLRRRQPGGVKMTLNTFSGFFFVSFVVIFLVISIASASFEDSLSKKPDEVTELVKKMWFFPAHAVLNLILVGLVCWFFSTCESLDQRKYHPSSSFFVSIFSSLMMITINVFLSLGIVHLDSVGSLPVWTVFVVLFMDVFIFIPIGPELTGVFFVDVVLAALVLTAISLPVSIGIISVIVSGFNYPWSWLIVGAGIVSIINRFFLWKFEK